MSSGSTSPRILYITAFWPRQVATRGAEVRARNVLRALEQVGNVEVVMLCDERTKGDLISESGSEFKVAHAFDLKPQRNSGFIGKLRWTFDPRIQYPHGLGVGEDAMRPLFRSLNAFDGQLLPALFRGGLVFAVAWYCWRRGWIGGGDVKLLTACVLLVPPASVPELMLSTATAGGLLAVCYLALARLLRGNVTSLSAGPGPAGPGSAGPGSAGSGQVGSVRRHNLLRRVWRAEQRRIHRRLSLPYSCAITAGVLLTLYVPLG